MIYEYQFLVVQNRYQFLTEANFYAGRGWRMLSAGIAYDNWWGWAAGWFGSGNQL